MLLIALIPHGKIKDDTWEKAALGDTEKEPRGEEPRIILDHAQESCDHPPYQRESR